MKKSVKRYLSCFLLLCSLLTAICKIITSLKNFVRILNGNTKRNDNFSKMLFSGEFW